MFAVIEVQDSGSNVATLTTQFTDYESALSKFHNVMTYAALSNLQYHGAIMVEHGLVTRNDFVQRDVISAYPRSGVTELSSNWLAYNVPTDVDEEVVIFPEQGKIYILAADSVNYNTGDQFRWNGTSYYKI